jgi:hypothetical protein
MEISFYLSVHRINQRPEKANAAAEKLLVAGKFKNRYRSPIDVRMIAGATPRCPDDMACFIACSMISRYHAARCR